MIKVELLDNIFSYDNTLREADDMMRYIEQYAGRQELIIDSMDINGIVIYSGYLEHIIENIKVIDHIKVNLTTIDEFIIDTINTTYQYIQGALPGIQNMTDSFYTGEKDASLFDDLNALVEGIIWVYSAGEKLGSMDQNNQYINALMEMKYDEAVQRLKEAFTEMKEAIKNTDYILIADILNYEIIEVFINIMKMIENLESKA